MLVPVSGKESQGNKTNTSGGAKNVKINLTMNQSTAVSNTSTNSYLVFFDQEFFVAVP